MLTTPGEGMAELRDPAFEFLDARRRVDSAAFCGFAMRPFRREGVRKRDSCRFQSLMGIEPEVDGKNGRFPDQVMFPEAVRGAGNDLIYRCYQLPRAAWL